MSFVSHVSQKLRYDQTWEELTLWFSSVILFVFPHEHNSICFLLSAMQSMKVKAKWRIISSYCQKLKVWCLYKMLRVKILTTSSNSNYKLNTANNAKYVILYTCIYAYVYVYVYIYIGICFYQISNSSIGLYCIILRENLVQSYVLFTRLLYWLCHRAKM